MKSVLISIQPKWCELIASGKKTVEVRKTRPKLETPFKCYIYCTSSNVHECLMQNEGGVKLIYACNYKTAIPIGGNISNGKVIGEFVCACMTGLKADNIVQAYYNNTKDTCLTDEEIKKYANGGKLYYWHISDLVIYDEPKELGEFYTVLSDNDIRCKHIQMRYTTNGKRYNKCTLQNCVCEFRRLGHQTDCDGYEILNPQKPITRPPQSWCYVEEVEKDCGEG